MSVRVFLKLVEAKAKIASVFPFFMGLYIASYVYGVVNWPLALTFFVAMLLFNMAVDAHDNYSDYRHATKEASIWKQQTNIIGVNQLSMTLVRNLIILLAGSATVLGLMLVLETGWPLLVMGVFCFAVGYFYAAGPRPISTTPFGEIFSGLTMGFVITLISVYLNIQSVFTIGVGGFLRIFLASGITVFAISNIMLANNLCDAEEDRLLNRKTVVYYFGKPAMLKALIWCYVAGYVCLVISVFWHSLPYMSLWVLGSMPLVLKNTRRFQVKQVKKETFRYIVKNAIILAVFCIVFIGIGTLLNW